jgi:hypothetical protein
MDWRPRQRRTWRPPRCRSHRRPAALAVARRAAGGGGGMIDNSSRSAQGGPKCALYRSHLIMSARKRHTWAAGAAGRPGAAISRRSARQRPTRYATQAHDPLRRGWLCGGAMAVRCGEFAFSAPPRAPRGRHGWTRVMMPPPPPSPQTHPRRPPHAWCRSRPHEHHRNLATPGVAAAHPAPAGRQVQCRCRHRTPPPRPRLRTHQQRAAPPRVRCP